MERSSQSGRQLPESLIFLMILGVFVGGLLPLSIKAYRLVVDSEANQFLAWSSAIAIFLSPLFLALLIASIHAYFIVRKEKNMRFVDQFIDCGTAYFHSLLIIGFIAGPIAVVIYVMLSMFGVI